MILARRFLGCARGEMMSPHDDAIDDEVLHVRVIDEMLRRSLPYITFRPSDELFVGTVPVAVLGWKHPPLCACPGDPENGSNEPFVVGFLSDVHIRLAVKELKHYIHCS